MACDVDDAPAYKWRSLMIDVSRHFFPIDFLKKQIDVMAQYKFNRLHIHLTDAAGWRIEIKRYPRLTNFAAWRPEALWKDWSNNGAKYTQEGTDGAYGMYSDGNMSITSLSTFSRKSYVAMLPGQKSDCL